MPSLKDNAESPPFEGFLHYTICHALRDQLGGPLTGIDMNKKGRCGNTAR